MKKKKKKKERDEFSPDPGTYQGTCPKCGKLIIVKRDGIVLSGSPPEFPILIGGHCHFVVPMSLIGSKKS